MKVLHNVSVSSALNSIRVQRGFDRVDLHRLRLTSRPGISKTVAEAESSLGRSSELADE
jgi:hypothetical protein